MKYAKINDNGFPIAFYSEDIYGSYYIKNESTKTEISKEEYESCDEEKYICETEDVEMTDDDKKWTETKYFRYEKIINPIYKDTIPIADELWREHINGQRKVYVNGEWKDYAEPEEVVFKRKKKGLFNLIQNLSDDKQKDLQNYLAGRKVTDEQIQRYKTKYQLALKAKESGDYSQFELEAELNGVTAENLVDLIIQKAEEWQSEIDKATLLIEAYRVKAQKEVESKFTDIAQYDLFMKYIEKAKAFELDVTDDEIKQLFTDFEAELSELNNA